MDQNTKDLIDIVEEKDHNYTQLEKTIESLKEETTRLKFTIREQKRLIDSQESKIPEKEEDIPTDIKILKDLIINQREEINAKDNEISALKNQIDKTEFITKDDGDIFSESAYKEELFEANNKITKLSKELERYNKEIESLTQKIDDFQSNNALEQVSEELTKTKQEMENYKTKNEDLEGHINYLQNELDKTNLDLSENIDTSEIIDGILKDIEEERKITEEKIKNYEEKIIELENEINLKDNELNQLIEKSMKLENDFSQLKDQTNKEQAEDSPIESDLTSKIIKELEEEVSELKNKLINVEPKDNIESDKFKSEHLDLENLPKYYQLLFFENLLSNLPEENRNNIIDSLIRNLRSNNSEIRRFAVKILRNIKSPKILSVLKDFTNDTDWLIRFYTVKALTEFKDVEGLDEIMNQFLKDNDVDVREIAKNYFIERKS